MDRAPIIPSWVEAIVHIWKHRSRKYLRCMILALSAVVEEGAGRAGEVSALRSPGPQDVVSRAIAPVGTRRPFLAVVKWA